MVIAWSSPDWFDRGVGKTEVEDPLVVKVQLVAGLQSLTLLLKMRSSWKLRPDDIPPLSLGNNGGLDFGGRIKN